jgi:hypothetical protein
MINPIEKLDEFKGRGKENIFKRYQRFREDLDSVVCSCFSGENKTLFDIPEIKRIGLIYGVSTVTDTSLPIFFKVIGGVLAAGYLVFPIAKTVQRIYRSFHNAMGSDAEY